MSVTRVRQRTPTFIRRHLVARRRQTETPLPEHNGSEKPGRATAPKGTASPVASQAAHLAFAHFASAECAPADVLGRQSDTSSTTDMHDRDHTTIYSTTANQMNSRHVQPRPTTSNTPWTLRMPRYGLSGAVSGGSSGASNQSRVNRGVSGTREVLLPSSHNPEGTLFTLDVLDVPEMPPSIPGYSPRYRRTTRPRGSRGPWTWLDVAGWSYV